MEKNNYIVIQNWMTSKLKLSGNELLVYALIYGFSQDGESYFYGSANYIADFINVSKRSILKILNNLTEKQLLSKKDIFENNVKRCYYQATIPNNMIDYPVKKVHHPGEESSPPPVKKVHHPGEESSPNNIVDNLSNNLKNTIIVENEFSTKSPESSRTGNEEGENAGSHALDQKIVGREKDKENNQHFALDQSLALGNKQLDSTNNANRKNKSSKGGGTRDKARIGVLLEKWNSMKCLPKHSLDVVEKHWAKRLDDEIDLYGLDVTMRAIELYDEVQSDHEKYFFNYRWPLWDFVGRGLSKFIEEMNPLENFTRKKDNKRDNTVHPIEFVSILDRGRI